MAAEKTYVFRPHHTLSCWLLGLLAISGLLIVVMIFTSLNERRMLYSIQEGAFSSTEEMMAAAEFSDLLQGGMAILEPGAEVKVSVEAAEVHLFDPETTVRLT